MTNETESTTSRTVGATLLLGIYLPDADRTASSPDDVANAVRDAVNRELVTGPDDRPAEISLFPAPQWLDKDALAGLTEIARRYGEERKNEEAGG